MTNYQYFSGANVFIKIAPMNGSAETLIECAGISYSYQNSRQPVYGFASTQYDAMLNGRELVQGSFVVNYVKPDYIVEKILSENVGLVSTLTTPKFDIEIIFGNDTGRSRRLRDCYLISMGQTVQISEQVILEEYSFLARSVESMLPKLEEVELPYYSPAYTLESERPRFFDDTLEAYKREISQAPPAR